MRDLRFLLAYIQRDAENSSPPNSGAQSTPLRGYFTFPGMRKGITQICAMPTVCLVRTQCVRFEGVILFGTADLSPTIIYCCMDVPFHRHTWCHHL